MEYIDKQKALEAIKNACKYPVGKATMRQATYNAAISDACRSVDATPSADVEPVRHGRWIQISEMNLDRNVLYECSECHFSDTHAVGVDVPYCWHCGARMDANDTETDYEWSEEEQAYIPKHIAGNKYDDINVDEVVCDMGDFLGGEVDG